MKYLHNQFPKVSIMLCAYNAAPFIKEAIDSILAQTYLDYELIVVDDGSNDETITIVKNYHDYRIRLIQRNHDYISSLNQGLKVCRGQYIARMDADDIMCPNRIERQVEIMDKKTDIMACFSWAALFGANEGIVGACANGIVEEPYLSLLTGNYLVHPTAMLRSDFIKSNRIHYKRYLHAEDYKMWTDLTKKGATIYVLPEILLLYRVSSHQVSYIFHQEQKETKIVIQQEIIETLIKRLPKDKKNTINRLFQSLVKLNAMELIQGDDVIGIMYKVIKHINKLIV